MTTVINKLQYYLKLTSYEYFLAQSKHDKNIIYHPSIIAIQILSEISTTTERGGTLSFYIVLCGLDLLSASLCRVSP